MATNWFRETPIDKFTLMATLQRRLNLDLFQDFEKAI